MRGELGQRTLNRRTKLLLVEDPAVEREEGHAGVRAMRGELGQQRLGR